MSRPHFIFDNLRYTPHQRLLYVSALKHLMRGRIEAAIKNLYKAWN